VSLEPGVTRNNADTSDTPSRAVPAGGGRAGISGAPDAVLGRIYRPIAGSLARAELAMRRTASESHHLVRYMSSYLLRRPGKRIRGALVLFSARAGHAEPGKAAKLAAIVEMLHLASLVHDDIIDGADRRRGLRALHAVWGIRPSILMGDYLFSRVANLLIAGFPPGVLKPILRAAEAMCDGEIEEEAVAFNSRVDMKRHLGILKRKTAELMAAACEAGGILGGASPQERRALRNYGLAFGMGFQLTDDGLNFSGTESELGKPVKSDLTEGRFTCPLLFLRGKLRDAERQRLLGLLNRRALSNGGVARVEEMVERNGGVARTLELAASFFRRARKSLRGVPASAAGPLADLARYAEGRRR